MITQCPMCRGIAAQCTQSKARREREATALTGCDQTKLAVCVLTTSPRSGQAHNGRISHTAAQPHAVDCRRRMCRPSAGKPIAMICFVIYVRSRLNPSATNRRLFVDTIWRICSAPPDSRRKRRGFPSHATVSACVRRSTEPVPPSLAAANANRSRPDLPSRTCPAAARCAGSPSAPAAAARPQSRPQPKARSAAEAWASLEGHSDDSHTRSTSGQPL